MNPPRTAPWSSSTPPTRNRRSPITRSSQARAASPAPGGEEKAPPAEEKKGKAPPKAAKLRPGVGPEALEFRDEHSTNFVDGILTLIPLKNIRSIDYDNDKQTVTVKVISAEKGAADEILTGATKFRGINKLTIEAEVDKGDMGIAELKFQGGVPKGIHALSFPVPRAPAAMPA